MRSVGTTLALAATLAACRPSSEATTTAPPASAAAASSSATVTATTAPAPAPAARELALLGGELVDLGAMRSVRVLTPDLVIAHALTPDAAYLHVRDVTAGKEELRAYDLTTAALRWTKPVDSCWELVATRGGVFCGNLTGVTLFDAASGAARVVGPPGRSASLVVVGARVLALTDDKILEALDENGVRQAHVVLPFRPDRGYAPSALVAIGGMACGAHRSDAATGVLCVDASTRTVWSRSLPVRGGSLRQADADAIVIASDTWTATASSAVLRTSDGSTLLDLPHVRASAALLTRGAIDGVFAGGKDASMYDAKGALVWTSPLSAWERDGLRVARSGPNVVLAIYSSASAGCELRALDFKTGASVWRADVELLSIAHSKYSNDVELRADGSRVLLLGTESQEVYAETFDPTSGRRRVSLLRGR